MTETGMVGLNYENGEPKYRVRDLQAGDTRRVGAMIARVTGDPRIQSAVSVGEQGVIVMSVVACLLDQVPIDLALWCASLIGVTEKYDIQDYVRAERQLAQQENRQMNDMGYIRMQMESDIVDEMDRYPVGAYMDILNELMQRPTFDDFLASTSQLGKAITSVSSRFQKQSKNGSRSKTKKS